jgi:hypothetical protein
LQEAGPRRLTQLVRAIVFQPIRGLFARQASFMDLEVLQDLFRCQRVPFLLFDSFMHNGINS